MFGEDASGQLDPFAAQLFGAGVKVPFVLGFEKLTFEELLLRLRLLAALLTFAHSILLPR